MSGRIAVITGSNSGTGFWCANALASKGATVVLACRTISKAEAAKQEILGRFPSATIDIIRMDGMDFESVREFAKTFSERYSKLDLLVNNAGINAQPEQLSKDGHDIQLQTNHLSHFLLTQQLWPKILAAGQSGQKARVVSHSSAGHWMGGTRFDREQLSVPPYGCMWGLFWAAFGCAGMDVPANKRYNMSKLCNVVFGLELQRRIEAAGLQDKIASTLCHPGFAATQFPKKSADSGAVGKTDMTQQTLQNGQSAADGSLPLLMASVGADVKGGDFIGPSGKQEFTGPPKVTTVGSNAKSEAMAKDLWAYSEEVCNAPFDVKG